MAKIRILPEQLANQIAAGEVIERPASVVKELVENSLDAGSTRIEIEIEGGGTRLIRIIDNGEGMDEDDLLLSLERHGTSKILTEEDLQKIATLGFRGEAIPSIGSVSQLTIISRVAGAELGTQVVLNYGKLLKVHETGCRNGTTVEVRKLFGNTPARKKFLRTVRTELGHIDEVVRNYALGMPEVTFLLRIDGRETLNLDASLSEEARLAALLRFRGTFIEVGNKDRPPHQNSPRIYGWLVPPHEAMAGQARLRVFVNGRAVRDRMVIHAVAEGMRSFLMKGKNPAGLLHLHLPPSDVDVNVHPAKHEIRFRNSRDLHALISRTVADAMGRYQDRVRTTIFSPSQRADSTPVPTDSHMHHPVDRHSPTFTTPADDHRSEPYAREESAAKLTGHTPAVTRPTRPPETSLFATAEPITQPPIKETVTPVRDTPAPRRQHHHLEVIGQFDNLYIFCRNSEGLLVIDQHAAHERLLYEKFRRQYQSRSTARQTLMFPETIELGVFQSQLVENNSAAIDQLGFSIRDFGGNTYIISAVPAILGKGSPRELFLDMLTKFGAEQGVGTKEDLIDSVIASLACKAAVKAGTHLSPTEIDALLNEMVQTDLFSHCPHGRPVARQFSREEIKKWFHRS